MVREPSIRHVYKRLRGRYGEQNWWPADSTFEIMVGAVLTQNTAWINVERALANLTVAGALDPVSLTTAHPKTVAKWLRPSGYFNVKTKRVRALCRWLLQNGGLARIARWDTDRLRAELLAVNGVGQETADDILLYAFQRPLFVVDAYTRRIFSRLGLCVADESYDSLQSHFHSELPHKVPIFNNYHALIVHHGKHVCRVRPLCVDCCLADICPGGAAA
ncbi:MAG: endonuclease [Gammaproteobacteria bacterium]|nr:endonuclease [Gammaproteobacteria bacterium]